MSNLNKTIKELVRSYLENETLSDVIYGTYTAKGIKIEGKPFTVPFDMVDIPFEHHKEIDCEITFSAAPDKESGSLTTSVPILEKLSVTKMPAKIKIEYKENDRLILIQKKGGQRFAVVGRLY